MTKLSLPKRPSAGFTLVELLIVIAIIGILAIAVLAAINPIEQLNKAKDSNKRDEAGQVASAFERYFAANSEYPWNTVSRAAYAAGVPSTVAYLGATADSAGSGICKAAANPTTNAQLIATAGQANGCSVAANQGVLITGDELKSQFASRLAFKTAATYLDKYYIIKEANDTSVRICYIPLSKNERVAANMKYITAAGAMSDCVAGATPVTLDYTSAANSCFVCLQ
jgi:prepilin-type N-terminal cleavage/methylation domain-containing protein